MPFDLGSSLGSSIKSQYAIGFLDSVSVCTESVKMFNLSDVLWNHFRAPSGNLHWPTDL